MAKLIKKSVDEKAVLAHPKQSVSERFFASVLSKALVAVAFAAVVTWIGKADAYVAFDKTVEVFEYTRQMIFILGGLFLLLCLIIAPFKEIFWKIGYGVLSFLCVFAILGGTLFYVTIYDFKEDFFEYLILLIVPFFFSVFLPAIILPIEAKLRKWNSLKLKKEVKTLLYIWLGCFFGLILVVALIEAIEMIK